MKITDYKQIEPADILVVDDNVDNLRILTAVLRDKGYKARQVRSGERALEAVFSKKPNLILLDIQMPGMNGFEVCKQLKSDSATKHIPVIFISAQISLESKVEGFKVGGSDYITKPFQIEEVLARVGHQLEIQTLNRHLDRRNSQLERVLETFPTPYVISTTDGKVIDYNQHSLNLFGVKEEEVEHYDTFEFYADPEERNGLVKDILESGFVYNREIILQSIGGRSIFSLLSASTFDLEGDTAIFVSITDITEQKVLEKNLEQLAMTDPLTGIHNRRAFFELASRQNALAQRSNLPVSVLSLDIDFFKKINDSWGHDVGDQALQHFAQLVSANLREGDVFGRLGGEEFAIILFNAHEEEGRHIGERIRHVVEASSLTLNNSTDLHMTVSGGLAVWHENENVDIVLAKADNALYASKKNGRNRITFWQPDQT